MAIIFGENLTKKELLQRVGNIESIAGVHPIMMLSGPALGLRVFQVNCGRLRFQVLIDRCLDIGECYYDGMPIHFLSRTGTTNSLRHNEGANAIRSVMGGLMFTCGLLHVGASVTDDTGCTLPMHGRIRNTPATNECAYGYWEGDEYYLTIKGEMRETALFGSNLVLRRTISVKLGEDIIYIHDKFENEGFVSSPLKLLYHCNLGYPLLDETAYMKVNSSQIVARDEWTQSCMELSPPTQCQAPIDNFPEQVFYHRVHAEEGYRKAALVNPTKGLMFTIRFGAEELTGLTQWKSRGSGDYVLGMEPTNCLPKGIGHPRGVGDVRIIQPGEVVCTELSFSIASLSEEDGG